MRMARPLLADRPGQSYVSCGRLQEVKAETLSIR
jgi:hypothetical protein